MRLSPPAGRRLFVVDAYAKNMSNLVELPLTNFHDADSSPAVDQLYIRRGSSCPRCGMGKLDYNGMLDLECDQCGYSLVEGAACG